MDTAEDTAIRAVSDLDLRVPFYCEENAWRVVYRHLVGVTTTTCINTHAYEYNVVFISSEARCCPFYRQRAKPLHRGDECVCWDYHVIVIRTNTNTFPSSSAATTTTTTSSSCSNTTEVLDVDSWLPYPCPINCYLNETFRPSTLKTSGCRKFCPLFRVVPAHQYIKYFFSDRLHMFQNGKWMASPPEYKPIMNGLMHAKEKEMECKRKDVNISNLEKYIDMVPCYGSGGGGDCGSNDTETTTEKRMGSVFTFDEFRALFTLADTKDEP